MTHAQTWASYSAVYRFCSLSCVCTRGRTYQILEVTCMWIRILGKSSESVRLQDFGIRNNTIIKCTQCSWFLFVAATILELCAVAAYLWYEQRVCFRADTSQLYWRRYIDYQTCTWVREWVTIRGWREEVRCWVRSGPIGSDLVRWGPMVKLVIPHCLGCVS